MAQSRQAREAREPRPRCRTTPRPSSRSSPATAPPRPPTWRRCSTSAPRRFRDAAQASVPRALGLVAEHEAYRGVRLSERGRAVALEVIRHHRLLELFLVESLDMSWDEVHAEAEVLEHALSEELEEPIAAKLRRPDGRPGTASRPRAASFEARRDARAGAGGARARRQRYLSSEFRTQSPRCSGFLGERHRPRHARRARRAVQLFDGLRFFVRAGSDRARPRRDARARCACRGAEVVSDEAYEPFLARHRRRSRRSSRAAACARR